MHARVTVALAFVALSRITIVAGFYLSEHEEEVGNVVDGFALGSASERHLVDWKFSFSIVELTEMENLVALDF